MPTQTIPVIAIVGAGFSGTLLACHLLRRRSAPLEVVLVERSGTFGVGLAYGTADPQHLLNVSVGAMSAWHDDSSHLLRWLDLNRDALTDLLPDRVDASSFIPRKVYGLYLQSLLEEAEAQVDGDGAVLRRVTGEVVDLEPINAVSDSVAVRYRVHVEGGRSVVADQVVLACGNSALLPPLEPLRGLRHGWAADATHDLDPDATVALLGTGLTMVDMVASLRRQGHRGRIVALSRRGLRPNRHGVVEPIGPWLVLDQAPSSVLGLWRLVRRRVADAELQGLDWRAVIDGLRPITPLLWQRLGDAERRRFLRHVAVVWDVHRHRIAPSLHDMLQELIRDEQLSIVAGRLIHAETRQGRLRLQISRRGTGRIETMIVDRLIQCTGIPLDYRSTQERLLTRMRQRQLLHADPLGLGALCTDQGMLINASGNVQTGLYIVGSPRKGQLWETIAVPELRVQVRSLSDALCSLLPRALQCLPPQLPGQSAQFVVPTTLDKDPQLFFRQLLDPQTSTYTYLLADAVSAEAVLIDPVLEQVDRDLRLLQELNLRLRVCLETHLHTDHITAAGELRRRTGCQLFVPAAPGIIHADRLLVGGEELRLGSLRISVISTPGHSPEHLAYRIGNSHLFSGDALLIRGCGPIDFQNGDPSLLYDTLQRLLNLPGAMHVYPGHDYSGQTCSTVAEERRYNDRVAGRSREGFIQLMSQLRLAPSQRLHQALPANLHLGDLLPPDQHELESQQRQRDSDHARATETANKEIYNAYIGMFI